MIDWTAIRSFLASVFGDHSTVRNFVAMIDDSLIVAFTTWAAILMRHEYAIEHGLMVVGGLVLIGIRIYAALDDAKYRRERLERQRARERAE